MLEPNDFCTFCEEKFDRSDKSKTVLRVPYIGFERRTHESCWQAVSECKPLGEAGKEILQSIYDHEEESGLVQWCQGVPHNTERVHLAEHYADPNTSNREMSEDDWDQLTAAHAVGIWQEAILQNMVDNNFEPRTFHRMCVEIADIDSLAGHERSPEKALWELVEMGVLEWSNRTPIHFRVAPEARQQLTEE